MIFENAVVLLLGLIIGSFLNVVIYRLPRELSVVRPGSFCPGCNQAIVWYQNIPLLSWLLQRGKCGQCKTSISPQYPLVEFLTAFLFWASYRGLNLDLFGVISQVRLWSFISICISITFIDLEHRIIPDELSIGGLAFGLLTCYWDFRNGPLTLLLAATIGFGFFFLFALIYEKVTGRMGLGGGDIKFMGTIGAFLGIGGIWSSLLLSSIVGSIVGIGYAWIQKKRASATSTGSSESVLRTSIPYGPFLVLGALIELFFEVSKWLNG